MVYTFSQFSGFGLDYTKELASQEIAKFNNKFLKYQGRTDLTPQDVVTIANSAKESNTINELSTADTSATSGYIIVELKSNSAGGIFRYSRNFEQLSDKEYYQFLNIIANNNQIKLNEFNTGVVQKLYQICYKVSEVEISESTKMVKKIIIEENIIEI